MKIENLVLEIKMNGEVFLLQTSIYFSIKDLIHFFNYNENLIVLEYNGNICTPSLWSKLIVQNRDYFEIITIVGGG
jgi:thiamine biosynthesis protein ThiS